MQNGHKSVNNIHLVNFLIFTLQFCAKQILYNLYYFNHKDKL